MSLIYLQTLVLALIQGVSEFIPVSSSAHLIIFSNLITNYSSSVLMDTSLHLGSLIAITHYFWRDLIDFSNNKTRPIFVDNSHWLTKLKYIHRFLN